MITLPDAIHVATALIGVWLIARDVLEYRRARRAGDVAKLGRGKPVRLRGLLIMVASMFAAGLAYVFLPRWTTYVGGIGIFFGGVMIALGSYWDAESRWGP